MAAAGGGCGAVHAIRIQRAPSRTRPRNSYAAACTHHQPSLSLVVDQFLGFGHPRLSTRQQLITANLRPMTH